MAAILCPPRVLPLAAPSAGRDYSRWETHRGDLACSNVIALAGFSDDAVTPAGLTLPDESVCRMRRRIPDAIGAHCDANLRSSTGAAYECIWLCRIATSNRHRRGVDPQPVPPGSGRWFRIGAMLEQLWRLLPSA